MNLNATSQYALRIVSYMALNDLSLYTAKGLAENLNISYKYLTAIMTNLSKAGIIDSTRGRGGGFFFSKPLDAISLLDVLKVINTFEEDECIMGIGSNCRSDQKCVMHDNWKQPQKELFAMFDGLTLETIKNDKQGLRV